MGVPHENLNILAYIQDPGKFNRLDRKELMPQQADAIVRSLHFNIQKPQ